jgi:hypothetical protein
MVRIQQGNAPGGALAGSQERYVWPVHLPGWLAIGWQVASHPVASHQEASHEVLHPAAAASTAPVLSPEMLPPVEQAADLPVKGRRGRRRKGEPVEPAAADVEAAATTQAEEIEQTEASTLDPTAALALDASPETVLSDERGTDDGREADGLAAALSGALPDDLFDAPI